MTFVNDFLKSVAMPIGQLAKWLEQEHQVPVESTIEKWNELTGMKVTMNEDSVDCEEVEEQTINIKKKKSNTPACRVGDLDSTLCQHVFIAGNRKGQQCATKPKGGNDRCSAHKIKVKVDKSNSDTETSRKRPVKNVKKSKEEVKTDSESDTPKKNAPKKNAPKKKGYISDSESDDEELPTLITKISPKTGKKICGTASEFEEESD